MSDVNFGFFFFCEKWVPGFVVRSDALQYVAPMTVDDDGFVGFVIRVMVGGDGLDGTGT